MSRLATPRPLCSSPAATGGAGTFFEQHAGAYWLSLLLVRAVPPVLLDCTLAEVHFQTERLGWRTDDLLLVGETGSGVRRRLAVQVKRAFTLSAADPECRKALTDYWQDFRGGDPFDPALDRFLLVTLRGTNTLLEHLSSGLLDAARAASSGDDFAARLGTPGFTSAKAVAYGEAIRTIVADAEGRPVTVADIWPFLRLLHVVSLDLNTPTGQTEAVARSLLAHTCGEADPLAAAEATWNALLREVGEGNPAARSYTPGDLPEGLRRRHSQLGGSERRGLQALADHSALIQAGIRTTIGDRLRLGRGPVTQAVLDALEASGTVLVTGPAGSGKSAVGKAVGSVLAADHFVFCFRAEEFAHPHLDEALQRGQIPLRGTQLGAVLAGQGRKVLVVESVERLLEASTRDAFSDLLALVRGDPGWRLVLTCRDYSADLVRTSFLEPAGLGHAVVSVPPLDDSELAEAARAYPELAAPLGSPSLRPLLRNPYVLDMARLIPWADGRPLPQGEREFRGRLWQSVVRAEGRRAGGLPQRRDRAFVEIAVRRARALTPHVSAGDLDAEAVDGLRRDSLLFGPPGGGTLVAPAHDVLEDWAILHWFDDTFAGADGEAAALGAAVGPHPALRRTYRKWVGELVERDPEAADALFRWALDGDADGSYFRDDTLVALLRSPGAAAFLARHRAALLRDGQRTLRRLIQLLRVACVTPPDWLGVGDVRPSLFNVPDGPAWAAVLEAVRDALPNFTRTDAPLLLGLVEDWARGVSWRRAYPPGSEAAAAIAHGLLPHLPDYRCEGLRKRALQVAAKFPNVDRERFAALLRGGPVRDGRRADREFRDLLFAGLDGMPACRDMPELVVEEAGQYFLCTDADLQDEWGLGGGIELETLFGVREGHSHGFFPASAYRGPFYALLQHQPRHGLDLLVAVFNHSAEWYANPRVRNEYVEPPHEIALTFADDSTVRQWANSRLWNLYRGTSVGPNVLLSALMALERWLLEFAEAYPAALDELLVRTLKRSRSAALTAVVASAATAHPRAAGETLLVLLGCPACVRLDRQRLANESQAPSTYAGLMPKLGRGRELFDDERKEADARPHRRQDLEAAVVNLQLSPLGPRVHAALDGHRAALPPATEQSEEDRLWRLALHRMDLRLYRAADEPEGPIDSTPEASDTRTHESVRIELAVPDADLREMSDRHADRHQAMERRLSLLMWGIHVFQRDRPDQHDPARWRERLGIARQGSEVTDAEDAALGEGGEGFVAAVCVRDHWTEMTSEEQAWCLSRVCTEVELRANRWNRYDRVQRSGMTPDRPCAWVLPALVGRVDDEQCGRVAVALVLALTHAVDEVRSYAAAGIAEHLWAVDHEFALRCVNALAAEASIVDAARDAERGRPHQERRELEEIEAEAAAEITRRFYEPEGIPADALRTYDPASWFGSEASIRVLTILGGSPNEPEAIAAYGRLAETLVAWWAVDDSHRGREQRERNYEVEPALTDLLERFLLRVPAGTAAGIVTPLLAAVDRHPREIYSLLRGLVGVEDRSPSTTVFWSIWDQFAARVAAARWLPRIDGEHPVGGDLLAVIFLGVGWKDGVRHWRSLEGYADRLHGLFVTLPASARVVNRYVRFLYHVGAESLPDAFTRLFARVRAEPERLLGADDTVFMLESLLQRHVYGRPFETKRRPDIRAAVLGLLDALVAGGSSAAFRMRDDFATPLPATP